MKKLTILVAALFLVLPAFTLHVNAQADETVTTTSTEEQAETTIAETESEKRNRAARLEVYKKAYTQKLTEAAKTRVASRCVAAQALVNAHTKRSSGYIKSRSTVFDNLVSRLEKTLTNVGAEGFNNFALGTNIVELKTMVAEFKTAAQTYEQSLADVSAMDCKADPTAFKAALETSRANQKTALKASQAVKTYLIETVKPTLKALKAAAEAANSTEE